MFNGSLTPLNILYGMNKEAIYDKYKELIK